MVDGNDKTPDLSLNRPEEGYDVPDPSWADLLNENFTKVDDALSGDTTIPSLDANSLNTESIAHIPATGIGASLGASISKGQVVALAYGNGSAVFSPSSYASHDRAVQDAVKHLEGLADKGGVVHIPAVADDGTQFTIENTVTQDDTLSVAIGYHIHSTDSNGGSSSSSRLTTTINDGSPMFELNGDIGTAVASSPVFICESANLDGNDTTLVKVEYVNQFYPRLGRVANVGGKGLELSDTVFNGGLVNGSIKGASNTAVGIDMVDADGFAISQSVMLGGTFRDAIRVGRAGDGNGQRVTISGSLIEGADGTNGEAANIRIKGDARVGVSPATFIGISNNGAHGIFHEGQVATITPAFVGVVSGTGIKTGSDADRYFISPYIDMNADPAVEVASKPLNDQPSVVPREGHFDGAVAYPSPRWVGLRYPDGSRLEVSGSATVTAGTRQFVDNFALGTGKFIAPPDIKLIDNGSDTTVNWGFGIDTSNNTQAFWVEELSGSADASLDYKIYSY